MYGGRIVAQGSADDVFYKPAAPYTLSLLKSVPRISTHGSDRLKAIPGQPPSLINLPNGCAFAPRCEITSHAAGGICVTDRPESFGNSPSHLSRCHVAATTRDRHFVEELKAARVKKR